jgi:hypothetical protein
MKTDAEIPLMRRWHAMVKTMDQAVARAGMNPLHAALDPAFGRSL